MKNLISIGLCFLITLNTFGFNLIMVCMLQEHKSESLEIVEEHPESIPSEKIIVFNSLRANTQLINSSEILYNNEMYDIVYKIQSGDEINYYCINDNKDTELHAAFISMNGLKDKPASASGQIATELLKNLLKNYLPHSDLQLTENYNSQQHYIIIKLSVSTVILIKITPPPELMS